MPGTYPGAPQGYFCRRKLLATLLTKPCSLEFVSQCSSEFVSQCSILHYSSCIAKCKALLSQPGFVMMLLRPSIAAWLHSWWLVCAVEATCMWAVHMVHQHCCGMWALLHHVGLSMPQHRRTSLWFTSIHGLVGLRAASIVSRLHFMLGQ